MKRFYIYLVFLLLIFLSLDIAEAGTSERISDGSYIELPSCASGYINSGDKVDCTLISGSKYNYYIYDGLRGEVIEIKISSDHFVADISIKDLNNQKEIHYINEEQNKTFILKKTLLLAGEYMIKVKESSSSVGSGGNFTIEVSSDKLKTDDSVDDSIKVSDYNLVYDCYDVIKTTHQALSCAEENPAGSYAFIKAIGNLVVENHDNYNGCDKTKAAFSSGDANLCYIVTNIEPTDPYSKSKYSISGQKGDKIKISVLTDGFEPDISIFHGDDYRYFTDDQILDSYDSYVYDEEYGYITITKTLSSDGDVGILIKDSNEKQNIGYAKTFIFKLDYESAIPLIEGNNYTVKELITNRFLGFRNFSTDACVVQVFEGDMKGDLTISPHVVISDCETNEFNMDFDIWDSDFFKIGEQYQFDLSLNWQNGVNYINFISAKNSEGEDITRPVVGIHSMYAQDERISTKIFLGSLWLGGLVLIVIIIMLIIRKIRQ